MKYIIMVYKRHSKVLFAVVIGLLLSAGLFALWMSQGGYSGTTQLALGNTLIVEPGGSYSTITAAMNAAVSGDTILIRSGTYYEEVTMKSGVTVEKDAGHIAIVDGSESSLVSAGWTLHSGEVYYASTPWAVNYVAQDDLRLFRYGTLAALQRGGYFYDAGSNRTYVRLSDGSSPGGHQMHVARRNTAFFFNGADNVTIRGLDIRYCNGSSCVKLSGGANNNVIENNKIHGAKFLIDASGGTGNIIRNNVLYETGYKASGWSWGATKGSIQEGAAVFLSTGSATVTGNTITSGFDGIGDHGSSGSVYENNTISDCMDDGLELDIENGANVRARGNVVTNCLVGVSAAPVFTGPLYVYRNQFKNIQSAVFKLGWDTTDDGAKYFYHNSIYSPTGGSSGITYYGGDFGSGSVFRNNAIFVDRYAVEKTPSTLSVDLNYDNLEQTPSSKYTIWNGTEYDTLSAFRATGQEASGISESNGFVNPPNDLSLQSSSVNIDKGVLLPGFNDNFCGSAPDIGAFETGCLPVDTTAPTVSISSPAAGATISGTVNVTASASDNVGVTKVEFYVDSSLKSTDTSSPYSWSWNTTTDSNGSHTLTVKAYDIAGNVGTSATVSVAVNNPSIDTDTDGFFDVIEIYLGTDPNKACPVTTVANDEAIDAWPPDFNDDTHIDMSDIFMMTSLFGASVPPTPVRYDIASPSNSFIDISDIALVAGYFSASCTQGAQLLATVMGGSVTDSKTSAPIADARVSFTASSTTTAVANARGYYYFLDPPTKTLNVTASARGYKSQTKTITPKANTATPLHFSLRKGR